MEEQQLLREKMFSSTEYHSDELLNFIINYYLASKDFNGLPLYECNDEDKERLSKFIDSGDVFILSDDECENPFIKGFDIKIPQETQKRHLKDEDKCVVIYPTSKLLMTIKLPEGMGPYSLKLAQGSPQLQWVYFEPKILQNYFDDSRFLIRDHGYVGTISPREELYNEDLEAEFIKNYGLAHKKGDKICRAVCVLLYDLAKLTPKKQHIWKGYEVAAQEDFFPDADCERNLIQGLFCEYFWGFDALLLTISYINKLCVAIGLPHMFNKEFCNEYDEIERPDGFHMLWMPTTRNYYTFLETLEKIVVNNLSINVFTHNAPYVNPVERKEKEGSLVLLDKWLTANIKFTDPTVTVKNFLKPLRQLRKERQIPAHELYEYKYNETLWKKQIEMMWEILIVLMNIMLFLSSHPKGKSIEIPSRLIENGHISSKISFY